jgi:hypothetical protein
MPKITIHLSEETVQAFRWLSSQAEIYHEELSMSNPPSYLVSSRAAAWDDDDVKLELRGLDNSGPVMFCWARY